jgi:hypothetical protein
LKFSSYRHSTLVTIFGCSAIVASITTQLRADVILPTGLAPGTKYEIAFVTAGYTAATSTDINYYNNFVTTEANKDATLKNLGVSWHAIASTATVSAQTNAPFSSAIPVYNTFGVPVATSACPLYSGNLLNYGIYINQYGVRTVNDESVWTGTCVTGNPGIPVYPLGSTTGTATFGLDFGYSQGVWLTELDTQTNVGLPMYALSAPITVGAVPEPTSLTLLGTALLGLGVASLVRRRQA